MLTIYTAARCTRDDKWACEAAVSYAQQLSQECQIDSTLADVSPEGSYLCMGGPVSNAATRSFLEYDYIDRKNPSLGFKQRQNAIIRLPMEFTLDRNVIGRSAKQQIHRAEHGRSVPNWGVKIRNGQILFPNTEDRESDFLLITRITHWREERPEFADFRSSVTIFGSTHGVGTSAVRLLFESNQANLLKKIILSAADAEYWQVLLTINSMKEERHPYSSNRRLVAHGIAPSFLFERISI